MTIATATERKEAIRLEYMALEAFKEKWPDDYKDRIGYTSRVETIIRHVGILIREKAL